MAITTEQVKELRAATGVGIMECRKALEEAAGDFDKAVDIIRERGLAKAAKRSEREASEGVLELYSHGNGRVGVMVEVNSETDFVARSASFRNFAHELGLHIAAAAPLYIRPDDIPAEVLENERAETRKRALEQGQPEADLDRIIESRLEKFKDEVCLLRQPYIRDESMTVENLLHQNIAAIGENIVIRRFVRWEVGESTA
jgi:elongation factor Ts